LARGPVRQDCEGVDEIVFRVEPCEESGVLVASWDAPAGRGGITTQGADLRELQEQVAEALRCHLEPRTVPNEKRFHLVVDSGRGST
jgi:hypothetical protein